MTNHDTNSSPEQPDWTHLKRYGYAPGNYMNRCLRCAEVQTNLDKRARCCKPCAEKRYAFEQLQQCSCGDRFMDKCPGEWEPGCDLGNNPKYARKVPLEQPAPAWPAEPREIPAPDAGRLAVLLDKVIRENAFAPGSDVDKALHLARRIVCRYTIEGDPPLYTMLEQSESVPTIITVQEAWEAAGGNPRIKASKEDLITALQLLDKVCDETESRQLKEKNT